MPDFETVLRQRRSVRAFSQRPVPEEVIEQWLEMARHSPSWSNTQPYKIALAQGDVRDALAKELQKKYAAISPLEKAPLWKKLLLGWWKQALPNGDFRPILNYPEDLQHRRVETGKGLYQTLNISRSDIRARREQMARNFCFFDAPVVLFLFSHGKMGAYGALDSGIFLQSLMLSATHLGLDSCAQGALALWKSPVEKHFDIPEPYQLICGLSLGYADPEAPENTYQPAKRQVEELLISRKL